MARKSKAAKGKGKYLKCVSYRMKKAYMTQKQARRSCSKSMKGGSKCAYSAKSGRCHLRK